MSHRRTGVHPGADRRSTVARDRRVAAARARAVRAHAAALAVRLHGHRAARRLRDLPGDARGARGGEGERSRSRRTSSLRMRTGNRFKDVLLERAKAGVKVRMIYDAVGSFGLPASYGDELRVAGRRGDRLQSDRPVAPPVSPQPPRSPQGHRRRQPGRVHRRPQHRRTSTPATRCSAPTAGTTCTAGHRSDRARSRADVPPYVAARRRRSVPADRARRRPRRPATGSSYVRLLDNTLRRQRGTMRRTYLHVIRTARMSILIQNAYFLPDRGLRRALTRAVRRGVDVRDRRAGQLRRPRDRVGEPLRAARAVAAGVKILRGADR